MVTKTMKWVSITALLLAVSWRPSANYQIPLDFVVCACAALVVLALFSIKHRSRLTMAATASITDPTRGESL
jgi:hypothetical protein